jgi:hypothetical protein
MRPSRVDDLFVDQDEPYPDIRQQPGSAPGQLDEAGNASGPRQPHLGQVVERGDTHVLVEMLRSGEDVPPSSVTTRRARRTASAPGARESRVPGAGRAPLGGARRLRRRPPHRRVPPAPSPDCSCCRPTTPSSAATASGSPATPNASASSSSGTWGTRSPRPHNPVWAAPDPAALPTPPSHALTVPGEPCAVGESSLRAFSVA